MNVNIFRYILFLVLFIVLSAAGVALAAPVESVGSSRGAADIQTIGVFLNEPAVAQQLAALGVTPDQARVRLARLSDAQLAELAGQIELLQAGGTIQGGNAHPWGVMECIFKPLGQLLRDLYQLIFCWGATSTG